MKKLDEIKAKLAVLDKERAEADEALKRKLKAVRHSLRRAAGNEDAVTNPRIRVLQTSSR